MTMSKNSNIDVKVKDLRKSRYSYLFMDKGNCYVYSSMTNMLLQLSQEIYEFLVTGNIHGLLSVKEGKSFEFLLSKKIINSETEDDDLRNILKINYLQSSYQTSHMNLTLLPTEGCNLRCPYCFETEKSGMSMSDEVIDQDVRYISKSCSCKTLSKSLGRNPTKESAIVRLDIWENQCIPKLISPCPFFIILLTNCFLHRPTGRKYYF